MSEPKIEGTDSRYSTVPLMAYPSGELRPERPWP